MSNEEWAKVQEGWHRKNLNKLYLKYIYMFHIIMILYIL